jgi:hypothetical protein
LWGTEKGIYDAVGRIGEAETALSTAREKGGDYIVDLRKLLHGGEIELDIETLKELLDTKYWSEKTFRINIVEASETLLEKEVIGRLRKYKVAMDELGKERVFLVFVEEIPEELFKLGEVRIRNALGGDTSWLRIINGLDNLDLEG